MASDTDKDFDALAAELAQLRTEFAKLSDLLRNTARHAGEDAVRRARQTGEQAWSDAQARTDDAVKQIEQNPLAATGIAFVVGLFLGLIFGRR